MTKLEEPKARTSMTDGSKPQITRPLATAPRKATLWPWFLVALLVIGGAAAFWFYRGRTQSGGDAASAQAAANARGTPVVAATARQGDMSLYLVGLGAVDPFYTVSVHARVDGQIMKVGFQEGQLVKKDDPLFEIDPRPYEAALLQAQGQLDKDQAELVNAKLNVQRDSDAGTAISAQQLSTDVATEQQTEGAIEVDQAAINSAQLNVTYSHITSPINGRIGLRLVDEGNIVHATDTNAMAVITQLQPIAIVFNLPEDDIPRVVKAMKQNPKLPVLAYDRDSKTLLASGTLLTIDNEVNSASGTFACKAQFDNNDGTLFPSQFVNARLLVDTLHNAVIAPAAGVQQGPDSTFVYVVQSDNTVQLRNVTVTQLAGNEILVANGARGGGGEQTSVESGLSAGEVIVTDGVDKLTQGAKVQVSKPTVTRGGATTAASAGGSSAGWNQGAGGVSGDAASETDQAGAGTGTSHHHRAASGPADQAADQSTGGGENPDAGAAGGAAGGARHHHRPSSAPADGAPDDSSGNGGGNGGDDTGHHGNYSPQQQ